MKSIAIVSLFAVLCLFAGPLASNAQAGHGQAGACILFPYFNTGPGDMTIFRITNVSMDTVTLRLVFVDDVDCSPTDRWLTLTGGDTITFLDSWMNPDYGRGFMYAYVLENSPVSDPNILIGQEMVIGHWSNDMAMSFSIDAMTFKALNVVADDKIHLDGVEYEVAPKSIYFPGFFGQDYPGSNAPSIESKLILINLTGGKHFQHHADILVYNDNEIPFSTGHQFRCFEFVDLDEVSAATRNNFLKLTLNDPDEPGGLTHVGIETGWIVITGDYAVNPNSGFFIANASLLAVQVERVGANWFFADLPFHMEDGNTHNNGMLWSTSFNGQ